MDKHFECAGGACLECIAAEANQEAVCKGCDRYEEIVDLGAFLCDRCCNGPSDDEMDGCWRGGEKAAFDAERMEAARRLK